jgi:hypothetical protein
MHAPASHRLPVIDRLEAQTLAESGIEYLSRSFDEKLDALRQIERALSRVGRHVTNAREDPTLQSFWRGVERDLEDEAHRLALRIGEEATRLARFDLRPKQGVAVSQVARHHVN